MPKVLVIDDNRQVRETIKLVLAPAGYSVALASNGDEGLTAYRMIAPDLVITDILMPVKEGITTIRELRYLAPTLPIVAMSGGGRIGNMDFLKVAEQCGATATLAKPFDPDELLATVATLLRKAA